MLDLDETELVSFFSSIPVSEPPEEREFIGAPLFDKSIKGVTLRVSLSVYQHDLYLELSRKGETDYLLQYHLKEIESARIELDAEGREWLRVVSRSQAYVGVAIEPDITVVVECGP